MKRRIGGDPGAEQGRGALERNAARNSQHVIFIDGDPRRIAAIGRRFLVLLDTIVGEAGPAFAKLLFARNAGFAGAVGIDEAADADDVADLPFFDMAAELEHLADDFVARNHREDRAAPFVAGLVNIGMADATIKDVDQNIVRAGLAALDGEGCNRRLCGSGGIGGSFESGFDLPS